MKIYLCTQPKYSCPAVEFFADYVAIGEGKNTCRLTYEQFNILKDKIKKGEL